MRKGTHPCLCLHVATGSSLQPSPPADVWPLGGATQCCWGEGWLWWASFLPYCHVLLLQDSLLPAGNSALPRVSKIKILSYSFMTVIVKQLCCKLPTICLKQLISVVPPMLISVICGMHTALAGTVPPLCCTVFARTGITPDNRI